MIRVALDVQIADVSRAGIGQFASELLHWLPRVDSDLTVIPLRPANRTSDFSMPGRMWWDQVTSPRMARAANADVLLKSGFSVPLRSSVPTVVMLHDLAARRFPEQLHAPSAWFYGRFMPWTMRSAKVVLTASEFTAREAVEVLQLPREKLVTVLQGGDMLASPEPGPNDEAISQKLRLPAKFILHVGTIEPRKNLAFLVRATSLFLKDHPDYELILAGKEGWISKDVHAAAAASGQTDRIRFLGPVTDEERRVLLRRARVLAFPSLYEGFGLPPLEAMRSGTPVVASRAGSMPEIVGDAGILIDGYDEDTWAAGLSQAAEDGETRSRLRQTGLERAGNFSWERTSRTIAEILHHVVHA